MHKKLENSEIQLISSNNTILELQKKLEIDVHLINSALELQRKLTVTETSLSTVNNTVNEYRNRLESTESQLMSASKKLINCEKTGLF